MNILTIFEPAMCCETGVCGVGADATLINFTADIESLRKQGASIQRFNLAQEPGAFIGDAVVKSEIKQHGETCLPLILQNGAVASRGVYPERAQLQAMAGLEPVTQVADTPVENNETSSCGCAAGSSC